jgi:C4-dicarboxylate transporter DctM subunit
MVVFIFLALFFIMLFLGVPIAVSLNLSSITYLLINGDFKLLEIIAPRNFSGLNSFVMLAIPLFVLSGDILFHSKMSKSLVEFASSMVGQFRGGFASVTTLACMMFGAVSGSGAATASAIGAVIAPEAKEQGYDKTFIAALIAVAGPLGILIPPSVPLVVYGAATNTSIGQLLLAGIGPGLAYATVLIVYGYVVSVKRGYGFQTKFSFKKLLLSFKRSFWALLTPVIIIGGIYSGLFTPTEAAVSAVIWALIVGLVINRTLTLKELPEIFYRSALTSGAIMFVAGGIVMFSWVLTREQIPQTAANAVLASISNPTVFLFVSAAVLFVVGMLMDPVPGTILTAPLMYPMVVGFGIDPVYFGAFMTSLFAIGLVTPPVALTLYVSSRICGVSLKNLIPQVLPPIGLLLLVVAAIIFMPQIVMTIPNMFY